MFQEPVLYDSPQHEHASMAVLFCEEVLAEQGLTTEANQLKGIEVSDAAMARVALRVLYNLHVTGPAAEYIEIARHLCEQALGMRSMRAAG
jgi:hypothetical protein